MAASDPVILGGLTTVSSPPSTPTAGTTVTVTDAAEWLDPASVGQYNATIWPNATNPIFAGSSRNAERVRVTGKSGAVLTITRAQEGTTARTVLAGDQIAPAIAGLDFVDLADSSITAASITNTTAETFAYSPATQPKGAFKVGSVLRTTFYLLFVNGTGSAITYTSRLYFGQSGSAPLTFTYAISVPANTTYNVAVTVAAMSITSSNQSCTFVAHVFNATTTAHVTTQLQAVNVTHDTSTLQWGWFLTGTMGTASASAFYQSFIPYSEYLRIS
jgi:hypothetical protein